MRENKKKEAQLAKTKLHVLFIKDNEINQKIQINTKEVLKNNKFYFFINGKMSLNSFRCIF